MRANQRHDLTKITPLVLEANSIPIFSRVKVHCQRIYDDLSGSHSSQNTSSNGGLGKRQPKVSAVYAESNPASLVPSVPVNVDDMNSTDEEDFECTQNEAYQSISLAPAPVNLWPPTLAVGPKELSRPKSKAAQVVDDSKWKMAAEEAPKSQIGSDDVRDPSSELLTSNQSQGL